MNRPALALLVLASCAPSSRPEPHPHRTAPAADREDTPDDPPDEPPDDDPPVDDTCVHADVEGCVTDGDDLACTLDHDGESRAYRMHVRADLTGTTPLVFNFHGLNTTSAIERWLSHMNDAADAHGYVVVYPEGIEMSWNAGSCCGAAQQQGVDDVAFTLAILDHLRAPLCIDPQRVYASGLSNGGHMSYRLACEQSDVFAAIASVAGLETVSTCEPTRAVPVLHFHGTSDPIVNYDVGIDGVRGAVRVTSDWAARNGCSDAAVTETFGEVTCTTRKTCDAGSAVELCTVNGGGHQWPGGESLPLLGHNTTDIDATEMISAFFAAHARP